MSVAADPEYYDSVYRDFDSPLARRVRRESYGEDIGQHSWVTADELRADIARLGLSPASRVLDLGCGPCGPLTFVAQTIGCRVTGLEISPPALAVGRARAQAMGVDRLLSLEEADLNAPLRFAGTSFDAAISLDVVIHLRDRETVFREVRRVLEPGGKLLFTDAGVITGSVSSEEIRRRSFHGFACFSARGTNEAALERAGFRLLETEDRTANAARTALGRLEARRRHQEELERVEGASAFAREQEYLETVLEISRRGAVSRLMYLAEARGSS